MNSIELNAVDGFFHRFATYLREDREQYLFLPSAIHHGAGTLAPTTGEFIGVDAFGIHTDFTSATTIDDPMQLWGTPNWATVGVVITCGGVYTAAMDATSGIQLGRGINVDSAEAIQRYTQCQRQADTATTICRERLGRYSLANQLKVLSQLATAMRPEAPVPAWILLKSVWQMPTDSAFNRELSKVLDSAS